MGKSKNSKIPVSEDGKELLRECFSQGMNSVDFFGEKNIPIDWDDPDSPEQFEDYMFDMWFNDRCRLVSDDERNKKKVSNSARPKRSRKVGRRTSRS